MFQGHLPNNLLFLAYNPFLVINLGWLWCVSLGFGLTVRYLWKAVSSHAAQFKPFLADI